MENIIVSNFLTKIHWFNNNQKMKQIQQSFESVDSINDYYLFKDMVIHFQGTNYKEYKCFNKESLYYGHLSSLVSYCNGIKSQQPVYAPMIEHGINFSEDDLSFSTVNSMPAFIFQGDYKKKRTLELSNGKPVFCIGPYINYAKPYVSVIKKPRGKTLTVFPTHTYEQSSNQYNREKFVDDVLSSIDDEFSVVNICVYWNDVNDPVYDLFAKKGANLVSAGMRFDRLFISRLRTIIENSDAIAGNDIGTYIGYGLALGKKVFLIYSDITEKDENVSGDSFIRQVRNKNAFFNYYNCNQRQEFDELVNKYWGLDIKQYSPNEMMYLFNYVHSIIQLSRGKQTEYLNNIEKAKNLLCKQDAGYYAFFESRL